MKDGIVVALCAMTLIWAASISPSRADTYNISASVGGNTVSGYIDTTNGAGGFLFSSAITGYDITIGSSQITPSNNTATFLSGTILYANGGALYLDFDQPGILDASLTGSGDAASGTYWFNCGENISCTSSDTMSINTGIGSTDEEGRLVQIGTEAVTLPSPTPLPATLPLFAGGLGVVGYLARRRKQSVKRAFTVA
jgi:hypothetical protein